MCSPTSTYVKEIFFQRWVLQHQNLEKKKPLCKDGFLWIDKPDKAFFYCQIKPDKADGKTGCNLGEVQPEGKPDNR